MLVRKAFKFRLYPNKAQQRALAVQLGHVRFVYNVSCKCVEITTRPPERGCPIKAQPALLAELKRSVIFE